MIYSMIMAPLETVFDWIFGAVRGNFPQFGVIGAIAAISLCMNLLALPLYNVADRIQESERNKSRSLERWVSHIKRTFRGDERFMMLSCYYRQNRYHPVYAFRSTLPVLIQVPFFIAAYHYLSSGDVLEGAGFWIFHDLASPDALVPVRFGPVSFRLNALPVLMTAINCASGALYSRGFPLKEKLQIYLLAAVFLVLLYPSPSGLVIYWILNNVFSLVKNVVKRSRSKTFLLCVSFSALVLAYAHFSLRSAHSGGVARLFAAYILAVVPFVLLKFSSKRSTGDGLIAFVRDCLDFSSVSAFFGECLGRFRISVPRLSGSAEKDGFAGGGGRFFVLVLSGAALAVLCGLVLPSSVIATSPAEFSFLGGTPSPVSYVVHSVCVFFGFFVFWPVAVYVLFGRKVRAFLPALMLSFFACDVFNAYAFKFDGGNLDVSFSLSDVNALVPPNALFVAAPLEILSVALVAYFLLKKSGRTAFLCVLLFAVSCGMCGVGIVNVRGIGGKYREYAANLEKYGSRAFMDGGIEPVYHLSRTGRNVIVLAIDQLIGPYIGDIFAEFPEIARQYDGFTWYPNTLSFDAFTLQGSPAIFGGYEYRQGRMNERSGELLRDKNTEAHMVIAKLFADGGFRSMLTDPPWQNYSGWNLDVYEGHPEFTVENVEGKYIDTFVKEKGLVDYDDGDEICMRQIVNFSFLQVLMPNLRKRFYENAHTVPQRKSVSGAERAWYRGFSNLYYLPQLTDFDSDSDSFFLLYSNDSAHEVRVTPGEDLESVAETPNEEAAINPVAANHYRVDAAALRQLGKYFDYLRARGVWDNTRVIIVSDHGYSVTDFTDTIRQWRDFRDRDQLRLFDRNCAALLFKDFGQSGGVKTDDAFMVNADTLFLAKKGLGLSDTNPFTGKKLVQEKEDGVTVYRAGNWDGGGYYHDKKEFELDRNRAWHVRDDIFKEENWIPLPEWEASHGGSR